MNKIDSAKKIIRLGTNAALMCSFGKDSMVLLHLVRETLPSNPKNCHTYPVPIIYHRHPWMSAKNEFAESVIRSWALEVYDYPPGACGVKCNADRLELVARYPMGWGAMDLPMNIEEPIPRQPFVCGLQWLLRPKMINLGEYPWKEIYVGHKSSDVDSFEGPIPLRSEAALVGGIDLLFPLHDWTDDDIWDYIEQNHVPYDKRRYSNRSELPDKWLNPDYLHACTKCIDPRETRKEVMCPKLGEMVPNLGKKVQRLETRPDYIYV